jgi:glycerol-3-phosphate dehydrogenase subunit C
MDQEIPTMTVREGSLEAPTRHPIDWKNPEFFDEALISKGMERVFDICHGCRRCVSLCNAFPTLFDLVDESPTGRSRRRSQGELLEGRRPVLPVRHVLHEQVPVRAAAPVERRFPAPDAARQGRSSSASRDASAARQVLSSTDRNGTLAGIPVVVRQSTR